MKRLDITGHRFGHLTVTAFIGGNRGMRLCRCECGREIRVSITQLRDGQRSCIYCKRTFRRRTAAVVVHDQLSEGPASVCELAFALELPPSTVDSVIRRMCRRGEAAYVTWRKGARGHSERVWELTVT